MFGKAKGSAHEKDEQLPPAPQLQDSAPVSLAESDSTEISCIGPGMTVVGKISSEGTLNVFGRVEGELHASIVRISDGAQVEGTIAAQELTIGGRFKGTVQADRVMLTSSAVVEGEIHHRSLAIEENAWFAGASRPKSRRVRPEVAGPDWFALVVFAARPSVRKWGVFRDYLNCEREARCGSRGEVTINPRELMGRGCPPLPPV
jgi:cytoskeletal protein CcmA (bactofilin family)